MPVSSVLTKISLPLTCANGLDSTRVTSGADGAVLSTVTVRVAEVKVFPAASVVMTRSSWSPSASEVVSQLAE